MKICALLPRSQPAPKPPLKAAIIPNFSPLQSHLSAPIVLNGKKYFLSYV